MSQKPLPYCCSTESDSVVLYYSVVNLLRIVIHYSKYSTSVQSVVIHYISSSESLRIVNSPQIVNSLCVLFLVCRGPLGRGVYGGVFWGSEGFCILYGRRMIRRSRNRQRSRLCHILPFTARGIENMDLQDPDLFGIFLIVITWHLWNLDIGCTPN